MQNVKKVLENIEKFKNSDELHEVKFEDDIIYAPLNFKESNYGFMIFSKEEYEPALDKLKQCQRKHRYYYYEQLAKDNELARKLFADLDIKFYCYGLTKNGYPKHFSSLAYNNFNKFRCPLPYIKINNWIKEPGLSDYDKERLTDVRNLKRWLTSSPSINQDYVNYMKELLNDVFEQVE